MDEWHVMPVNDQVDHSDDDECVCGPTPEFLSGGVIYKHHSLDGREANE